ncbi:MAG: diguanylate cyclase [Candidatus Eremiobacterota bacterium]
MKDGADSTTHLGHSAESGAAPAGARNPYVKMLTGSLAGKVFKLEREATHLGRSPDNELVLDDPGVSRVHARLTRSFDGGVVLMDLKSTNGTFVAGRRVTQHALSEGDQIALGENVRLRFGFLDPLEERVEEQLFEKATRDPLTGAVNRAFFVEKLRDEVDTARSRGLRLAVALSDLDFFKKVNDTYGHPAGDAVLVEFVRRAQRVLRSRDLLGRLGGEEFGFLLQDCAGIEELLDRVRQTVASSPFVVPTPAGSEHIQVTMSAGISLFTGAPEENEETLLAAADEALYQAKRTGRNRVVLWSASSDPAEQPGDTVQLALRQKRLLTRLACQLPMLVRLDAGWLPAVLLDLSLGGMRLEMAAQLPGGREVEVTLAGPDGQPGSEAGIRARVQWTRSGELGLAFVSMGSPPAWLSQCFLRLGLNPNSGAEKRREIRLSADLPVLLTAGTGQLPARVLNLGLRGCLVEARLPVQPGLELHAAIGPLESLPVLECRGRVVRCLGTQDRYTWGIALEEANDPALLTRYVLELLRTA